MKWNIPIHDDRQKFLLGLTKSEANIVRVLILCSLFSSINIVKIQETTTKQNKANKQKNHKKANKQKKPHLFYKEINE